MIILIAESKTMTACDKPIDKDELSAHMPPGEEQADEIMSHITELSVPELAAVAKFSGAMAVKALGLAYEFPNKTLGQKSIEAFTGVVFRSFDYPSLDENDCRHADQHIRLISSLYGWLRPDDIVKAYRLDYNTPLATGDKPMWSFWKKDVTISLVKEIKSGNGESVLNLLPGDAAKMIDWKLTKNFTKVWKVDFKELCEGGEWKTPTSNRLKELRGHLLREIIIRRLHTPDELLTLETDRLLPLATPDYPDHIAFCVK